MAKIVKTVSEPTNLYIIGHGAGMIDTEETYFGITDDYSGYHIQTGKAISGAECDGFVFILTKEEMLKWREPLLNDNGFIGEDCFLIEEFQGDLTVQALNDIYVDLLTEDMDIRDDYIDHQLDESTDVTIVVPLEFRVLKFKSGVDAFEYIDDIPHKGRILYERSTDKEKIAIYENFLISLHTARWTGNQKEMGRLLDKAAAFSYARTNSNHYASEDEDGMLYERTLKNLK